jgi:hypothetical protein
LKRPLVAAKGQCVGTSDGTSDVTSSKACSPAVCLTLDPERIANPNDKALPKPAISIIDQEERN